MVIEQMFKTIRHFSEIGRSRSSAINPLQWTLVLPLFGLLVSLVSHGPIWLLAFFMILIAVLILLIVVAYIYFMIKSPDSLRSETFSLAKAAIEKHPLGDNLSGLRDVIDILEGQSPKLLGSGTHDEKKQ
jgi:hypothetical protein